MLFAVRTPKTLVLAIAIFGVNLSYGWEQGVFAQSTEVLEKETIKEQIEMHLGLHRIQKTVLIGIMQCIEDPKLLSEVGLLSDKDSESAWLGLRVWGVCYPSSACTIAIVHAAREPDDSLVDRKIIVISLDNSRNSGSYAFVGTCRRNAFLKSVAFEDLLNGTVSWKISTTDILGDHEFEGKITSCEALNLKGMINSQHIRETKR